MKRLGFISVVAVGMLGCQLDQSLPPGPNALIQDAGNGGNDFFFWQSPIANHQPPASLVLSRQLRPVVTITNQGPTPGSSATCAQGIVRTFSGSDLSISESQYHVNWDTDQSTLNAGCDYRITVRAASTIMGFADVDVVNSGKGLKNIETQETIALLDGRTLPIKFFIGVGSLCGAHIADCGEGVARGGENATIVTTSGRAGVFIPADALGAGVEVRITVKSVDGDRAGEFECIPGLFQQYPGTADVADNACYDYHAEPILDEPVIEQIGRFTFNTNVTVGICPDVVADNLEHPTRDLLQLFQFDVGASPVALKNVPAPFLRCDPSFSPNFGARRSMLGDLAQAFASLLTPRPLYARSNRTMLDIGTGGETEGFSRFTWALPPSEDIR